MSRKTTKSILSRDEISLLINSEEPKNIELYGNLYSVIRSLQNIKAVSLEQLTDIDNKAIAALTYNKKTLIETVIKEWYAEKVSEEDPSRKVRCGLCNTPNKYLYYIRNRKNNILLNVGSHCITKFPGIEGYIEQKKQLTQIHKGQQIVQRRNKFYDCFPDYEEFISDAEKYFSTLPILLPYDLYTNLQNTILRMRVIATKYVNEGKKPYDSQLDSFELFQLAIDNYLKLKIDADIHVSKNIDKTLICKRPEIDWLISQKRMHLLQQISKNNGFYNIHTLKSMCFVEFIQNYINLFVSKNNSEIIKFERLNGNSVLFSFNKLGYQPAILFSAKLEDFMQCIGADCIVNHNFTYGSKNILSISNIVISDRNLVSILEYIDNMINLLNCVFLIDDSVNTLYLCRKGDKAVRQFSKQAFMNNYSKYMVLPDEEIKKYLIAVVKGNCNTKWKTTEIQAKQGIDDKIGILYKSYKESHEYNTRPTGQIIEVMVYSLYNNSSTNKAKINFDSSEFISMERKNLKISDSQVRSIEYGLHIHDESLSPLYHKGDMLFIQPIQKFKGEAIILFASKDKAEIQNCYSESKEPESIFNYSNIHKKELIAYGRIIYCLHNENRSELKFPQKEEKKQVLHLNKVKILVVDNPKVCPECSSKCTYKLIKYIQEKKSRQINVAICPECNKYYIDRNSYLTYTKSKKETNLEFVLSDE